MAKVIENCLTCEEEFETDSNVYSHSYYCDDCGDPREGNESWDDALAASLAYKAFLKYGPDYIYERW